MKTPHLYAEKAEAAVSWAYDQATTDFQAHLAILEAQVWATLATAAAAVFAGGDIPTAAASVFPDEDDVLAEAAS